MSREAVGAQGKEQKEGKGLAPTHKKSVYFLIKKLNRSHSTTAF